MTSDGHAQDVAELGGEPKQSGPRVQAVTGRMTKGEHTGRKCEQPRGDPKSKKERKRKVGQETEVRATEARCRHQRQTAGSGESRHQTVLYISGSFIHYRLAQCPSHHKHTQKLVI